jgi:hypothetical protein
MPLQEQEIDYYAMLDAAPPQGINHSADLGLRGKSIARTPQSP